jgi:hypothetical protein
MSSDQHPSRRGLIRLGATSVLLGVALASAARAAAKTPKADVKYQYTPKDAAHCSVCASFIPSPDGGGGPGSCKIVDGPIPQNGWCVLFSPAR